MPGIVQLGLPTSEPVSLVEAKNYLKIKTSATSSDDTLISALITAARDYAEKNTGLYLASRNFVEFRDNFPFYPYFSSPYAPLFGAAFPFFFGFGPMTSYPLPAESGFNDQVRAPFDFHTLAAPVTSVSKISYIGTDGASHDLLPGTDFVADLTSTPARMTPLVGQRWPVSIAGTNSVGIYFTAGYDPDPTKLNTFTDSLPTPADQFQQPASVIGIPQPLRVLILMLVSHWYYNREPVAAGSAVSVPHTVDMLIGLYKVLDFGIGHST